MRLTKTMIDKITLPPDKGQIFYRDGELRGFALRVTNSGIKSFIVEKRINNRKVIRITIGRYGDLTAEQARKEAQKILGKIATGTNPIDEKKEINTRSITLREVFNEYLNTRKLKPGTIKDYKRVMSETFSDWQDKPLQSLTKDLISERHKERGKQSKARANNAMRVLRALFNFAEAKYEDSAGITLFPANPVKRLSKTRAWYTVKRRQNYIKPHQLKAWHKAVMNLENEITRDYLLLTLFTGLRPGEGAALEKSRLDLTAKTFTILDTKNHEAHTLPIADHLCEILKHRVNTSSSEFIFPGTGKNGYINDVRAQVAKVTEETGIKFIVYDLRRTFITIAESLDLSAYTLKRLLNHKIEKSDVTAGYIITDVERLRRPIQMISDYILEHV